MAKKTRLSIQMLERDVEVFDPKILVKNQKTYQLTVLPVSSAVTDSGMAIIL